MNPTTSSRVFSPAITWLGVLILTTGLATVNAPVAHAANLAVSTSSVVWSQLSPHAQVSGGLQSDFLTGDRGWSPEALAQAGSMGLEWSSGSNPAHRTSYFSSIDMFEPQPGGESVQTTLGLLAPDPSRMFQLTTVTRFSGNQARWSLELEATSLGIMQDMRFWWEARVPSGYDSVFHTPNPGTLIITDSSLTHPTLVMHATSSVGTVHWGGPGIISAALTPGTLSPTFYLSETSAQQISMTVTLGIIDHDPCSLDTALAFATANAGVYGVAWESLSACLAPPLWASITSGAEPTPLNIPLDPRVRSLEPDQTRELTIAGLPEGVAWSRLPDDGTTLRLSASATEETVAGEYPLTLTMRTRTERSGVIFWSEPLETNATMSIQAPEPEPEPEPEVATKPEEEPTPEEEPVDEPGDDPVTDEEDGAEDVTEFADDEPTAEPQPETLQEQAPSVQATPPVATTAEPEAESTLEPPAVRPRAVSPEPTEEPAEESRTVIQPSAPTEFELSPSVETPPEQPEDAVIPEPSAAGAWVGAGLLAATGLTGLVAMLRRRRDEMQD